MCSFWVSLTLFHITIPSVHLTYVHEHTILSWNAVCGTNREIIIWTLTLTVDVLCHTNCLIWFCYDWWCGCCCYSRRHHHHSPNTWNNSQHWKNNKNNVSQCLRTSIKVTYCLVCNWISIRILQIVRQTGRVMIRDYSWDEKCF